MAKFKDLTGNRYNRWTVNKISEKREHGKIHWLCTCDCGVSRIVLGDSLTAEKSKSCGCYNIEKISERFSTHRMARTPTHNSWRGMKERCYNSNNKRFKDYGGRGISVSSQWKDSFEQFIFDMGECPQGMSIERIDVNGNYEKSNCRWATDFDQAFNKRILKRNKSGVTGVYFCNRIQKWKAQISFQGKRRSLGAFNKFEDAVECRKIQENKALLELMK